MAANFVPLALKVSEVMEFTDNDARKIAMRFCKIYSPEKIGSIVETAKKYYWWQTNPKAAFMKAIGEVNRAEKLDKSDSV